MERNTVRTMSDVLLMMSTPIGESKNLLHHQSQYGQIIANPCANEVYCTRHEIPHTTTKTPGYSFDVALEVAVPLLPHPNLDI
jgi:hypothetical protein